MNKINWANLNYNDFELFCNALLTYEIGKKYNPFTAAGKDGGIDGSYSGSYLEDTGNWRFQFKFYQSARSEAVNNLKSQIKKEAAKLKGEDYFVLMTNVELLPQENVAMVESFSAALSPDNKCKCYVWDGAKINTLLVQFPFLELWINEGFTTAQIQDYRLVFKPNSSRGEFEPSSFSNIFVSREKDLEKLESFLYSTNSNIALITGEAGIGKTRLVYEFFNQIIEDLEEWVPLVLINKSVEFDKIRKALSSNLNYIILIDDAHNYRPEVISDMKALADNLPNKVKLLLTARTLDAFSSLTLIKEYESNNILNIKLDELSRNDTEGMFRHYLEHTSYQHYTNELILTSFGKPILIVAMLNAIFKNIPISQIKAENFLKSYVNNYFSSYIDRVEKELGITKLNIRRLLQNIVLIEPFDFGNIDILQRLSRLHNISVPEIKESLKLLADNGFVSGRFEQSVKPDYYSDILLSQIDQTEVPQFITEFILMIDNIIINLSSVNEIQKHEDNFLDEILRNYIKLIETTDSIVLVKNVMTTISNISFVKPKIAKEAVQICLKCLADDNHLIAVNYQENKQFINYPADTVVNSIAVILTKLYADIANLDFAYEGAFKLYNLTGEKKVANVFSFSKIDVIQQFQMTRANYFVERFSSTFDTYNERELEFGLLCCANLLNLEFTLTEWDAVNRDSIKIITYYLPASKPIKKMRESIANALFSLYDLPLILSLKKELLKQIIDIPRGIFATSRNNVIYLNDVEIERVLIFLSERAHEFDILDQKEILEKIHWFQKWGISKELLPLIDEVKTALKPKNLVETLSQLFSKAELSFLEMNNIEKTIEDRCTDLVNTNEPHVLASSIISFLEPQKYPPHYYFTFQNILERKYPGYAKDLHDMMLETSPVIYSMYGWRILATMYHTHHDEAFYWERVSILQSLDTVEADDVLLSVYGDRSPQMMNISAADIEIIINIFNKKRDANNFRLSMALQVLFASNYPNALDITSDYLDRAPQKQTEMFFMRLTDNPNVNGEQMEYLLLNHTIRYALTYEIERCLNILMLQNREDAVFEYLIKRFAYKRNIVVTKKTLGEYDFVPYGNHSRLFDQCEPDAKIKMFLRSLNWYLSVDNDGGHLFYAVDLLKYLRPSISMTDVLMSAYFCVFKNAKGNSEHFKRIIQSLGIFHHKEDYLIQTFIEAFKYLVDFKKNDEELYGEMRIECYIAITAMGVKSGPANLPFQVDIDLEILLKKWIDKISPYDPVSEFFKDVLKSVHNDINRLIDRDNSTW